ncbi:MAG: hypothetical protein Q8910_10280 [Bacteroidota bacterium]|nr:hypothetical protein [Bacteroidota bacterium]
MTFKKYAWYLFVLVVLMIIATIFFYSNNKSTLGTASAGFDMRDTTSISKIEVIKNGKTIALTKEKNCWLVDQRFEVRPDAIKAIYRVFDGLNIKTTVSRKQLSEAMDSLQSGRLKVVFYKHTRPYKTYCFWDNLKMGASCMLSTDSKKPYEIELPNYNGRIADLLVTDESYWRNNTVFHCLLDDIESVIVEYPDKQRSFKIEKAGSNEFSLFQLQTNKKIEKTDQNKLMTYLSYFHDFKFEKYVSSTRAGERDSVKAGKPYCSISLTDTKGHTTTVKTFPMALSEKMAKKVGKKLPFDPYRLYAYLNNDKDKVILKYLDFDVFMQEIKDFMKD